MALGRFLVSWKADTDLPEDTFTNTLYFNVTSPDPLSDPDWQALADEVHAAYATGPGASFTNGRRVTVKVYDMGNAEPRPVKATKTATAAGSVSSAVPQVAMALSYYADRNLPRLRGRVYLGPWGGAGTRPTNAQLTVAKNLALAFFDVGGIDVDWSIYSPTTGENHRINHGWIDDSWDVIRSRKIKAAGRLTYDGNG